MNIEFRHLRYFVAVADARHITRAAERLGIQQPPLSQQIKALEVELGVPLFLRHPKGVTLTDAGQLFYAEATRLLRDCAAMQERMLAFADGSQGMLSIGFTSSSAAHDFTPEALRVCRATYPGIQLAVSENNAAEITDAVASSRLHCGFLRVPVAWPKGVVLKTLLQEPAVLAMPRDHPLAQLPVGKKPGAVQLKDLQGEKFIFVRKPGAPGLYANLLELCTRAGVGINVVSEVDRMMTNLNLVAAGAGISVVPSSMQGTHHNAIVYRPLARAVKLGAPLTLAYRKSDCHGPTGAFVELVTKIAAERARGATTAA